jgi:WD40 repeat protein
MAARYTLQTTLPDGHANDITALCFSPDGEFLASGSGDGVLLIFSTSSWEPVKRFVDASSINTLIWHPAFPKTVISGYASGDVHTMRFESHGIVSLTARPFRNIILTTQQIDTGGQVWTDRMDGPVHRIGIDKMGTKIAIAYGREVAVFEQNTLCEFSVNGSDTGRDLIVPQIASWDNARKLPEPPSHAGFDEQLPAPIASSLHFADDGKVLIVSYSDHGIMYGIPSVSHSLLTLPRVSCWDLSSLESKWHITPRACNM